MSSLTGYLTKSSADLSFIFQSGNSGLTTGYLIEDGRDIGSIFQAYTSYAASLSGLISQSGADISTLFEGIPSISPLSISGCCLWLDAKDTSTIDLSFGKVMTWRDKSANEFVFQNSSSLNRPEYVSNSQNGLATLKFDRASSQYLQGPSNFSIGLSSYSLFAVCNITVANNITCSIFNKSQYGGAAGRIIMIQDLSQLAIRFMHSGDVALTTTTATYPVGNYRLLELIVNRGESTDYAYQNGSLLTSRVIADGVNWVDNSFNMLVGAYNNGGSGTGVQGGYFLTGNVAEIVSYKGSDMTPTNRQYIEGYLAWKWGIQTYLPSNHTYRNTIPR